MQLTQIPSPLKLTDGIFMGCSLAANDLDWLSLNQVTHIINCAGLDLPSKQYLNQGIQYLVFDWRESQIQSQLFGPGDTLLNNFIDFIEKSRIGGGSVLVHGKDSESRTCCMIVGYLMKHFGWNIFKTLEFVNSRNRDLQLEPKFFEQLNSLHNRLSDAGIIKPSGWETKDYKTEVQKIITNTYLNSQMVVEIEGGEKQYTGRCSAKTPMKSSKVLKKRVEWKDTTTQSVASRRLSSELRYNSNEKIAVKEQVPKMVELKSILKGFKNPSESLGQKRIIKIQQRQHSRNKERKQGEKQKQNQNCLNNFSNHSSSKLQSTKYSHLFQDQKQNNNLEFIQNQLVKEQGQFGRLRAKRTKEPQILAWTKTDFKNLKSMDQQSKRRQLASNFAQKHSSKANNIPAPIIIMKPNMQVSILQPTTTLKRSKSEKKQEEPKPSPLPSTQNSLSSNNILDSNYMKALRNKMNQTLHEPEILSIPIYKRDSRNNQFGGTGLTMRRERSSSAKMRSKDCKENDILSMNSGAGHGKPKWK